MISGAAQVDAILVIAATDGLETRLVSTIPSCTSGRRSLIVVFEQVRRSTTGCIDLVEDEAVTFSPSTAIFNLRGSASRRS